MEHRIREAVGCLRKAYGPQGWWPVHCERHTFARPDGAREQEGYHPGQFDFPRTRAGRFEICCGAVLTQNTAWRNVQQALVGLREANCFSPETLIDASPEVLGTAIRPAGYFNQKSTYLKQVAAWFVQTDPKLTQLPSSREGLDSIRPELLRVRGVGPETADSILLYAFAQPTFVVDAYTRRIFSRLGWIDPQSSYEAIRTLFARALRQQNTESTVKVYQETHALIVEHAKRHHGRGTESVIDPLLG